MNLTNATDTTLRTEHGQSVLRFQRRLAHPADKVWRAITQPADLAHWFPTKVGIDLRIGGKLRFVFARGEGPTMEGEILELDPPRVLAYSWGDSVLRFELLPEPDGCTLVFTHTFADRPAAASFAAGWSICLDQLEALLDGSPGEAVSPPWQDMHEGYVDRFGLLEGSLEQTADGWTLRFERQLTKPPAEVWAAMLDGGDSGAGAAGGNAAAAGLEVGDPAPAGLTNQFVLAGPITAVEPPRLLEYAWRSGDRDGGRVRWSLSDGQGGARLVLTQSFPAALKERRATLLAGWHVWIELLAERLRSGTPAGWPAERTEELRRHYAERAR
jgi:uncharacterized protein YndB with AHSA1/START domain